MVNAVTQTVLQDLHILCHACLRYVNNCMTACTMSALWLYDVLEALCAVNEIKFET